MTRCRRTNPTSGHSTIRAGRSQSKVPDMFRKHARWIRLVLVATMLVGAWRSRALIEWLAGAPSADERLVFAVSADNETDADQALADGASVEAHDTSGITPLMAAAVRANMRAAKDLLS